MLSILLLLCGTSGADTTTDRIEKTTDTAVGYAKQAAERVSRIAKAQRKRIEAKDDTIVSTVKERFGKDRRLRNAKIDVTSDAGVVTLSGEVPTVKASLRASKTAYSVAGVRSVNNTLATRIGL
jgi:osmotically-inducible protein OsmY